MLNKFFLIGDTICTDHRLTHDFVRDGTNQAFHVIRHIQFLIVFLIGCGCGGIFGGLGGSGGVGCCSGSGGSCCSGSGGGTVGGGGVGRMIGFVDRKSSHSGITTMHMPVFHTIRNSDRIISMPIISLQF